jgi:very-short-patch-repair endonuclease
VAQFLAPGTLEFDIAIVDEASQMRPEEAIGALVRAKRVVVVGDPMQLPPTNFFQRSVDDPGDDELEDEKIANESILDMALQVYQPARDLRWHYRSRHASLIAFSNKEFYSNGLITFPSPHGSHPDFGVHLRKVGGVYHAGTNPLEAEAIVAGAIEHMHRHPERSLGLVALNQTQRELIHEEVERAIKNDDAAAAFIAKWQETLEPFFVKNLENVQGDERDVIMISTVYGSDRASGHVMQRFGPITQATGHRRLNVLFTRAKEQTIVNTSMTSDQIRADKGVSWGVRALKGYLEYAATGRLEGGILSERAPDSDFEIWVAEQLQLIGCEAIPQVGVAGYFIDIGVRHPNWPHGFLFGIECDGAIYHSGKSARDRDRLRQDVLEGLGWDIYRIWSTDWFGNPAAELRKLRRFIERQLDEKAAQLRPRHNRSSIRLVR